DALALLKIREDLIREQRVEHVAEDLAWRGHARLRALHGDAGILALSHTDDEQPLRAEANRRTQRIELPHRTVAEILVAERHRRKQERNRHARKQMLEGERG